MASRDVPGLAPGARELMALFAPLRFAARQDGAGLERLAGLADTVRGEEQHDGVALTSLREDIQRANDPRASRLLARFIRNADREYLTEVARTSRSEELNDFLCITCREVEIDGMAVRLQQREPVDSYCHYVKIACRRNGLPARGTAIDHKVGDSHGTTIKDLDVHRVLRVCKLDDDVA